MLITRLIALTYGHVTKRNFNVLIKGIIYGGLTRECAKLSPKTLIRIFL
jgi:hypothetical protein